MVVVRAWSHQGKVVEVHCTSLQSLDVAKGLMKDSLSRGYDPYWRVRITNDVVTLMEWDCRDGVWTKEQG